MLLANLWHVRKNAKTYRYRYIHEHAGKHKVIAADRVGLILLAAGRSERFGTSDKLAEQWRGKPLAQHAAQTLSALPFAAHLVVTSAGNASLFAHPFAVIENHGPERGQSHSIALGVGALKDRDIDACLIALADMPLVPSRHYSAMLNAFDSGVGAVIATANQGRLQVPALFARQYFDALLNLAGDAGARALLQGSESIACDAALLADFDRPEDFAS
ncbi:NTP transferase domain-containing protein [Altererythrobacter sp. MF3-039]|uniref:nucleotidyltransferase family protein n=1 Tax=Altererythrobacter sp. MF3-039 TaxID=3252901 RepID=UPI00390C5C07